MKILGRYVFREITTSALLGMGLATAVIFLQGVGKLLEVLVRHPGRLLSQRQLLAEVWGPGYENAHGNLRLYMGQLRRKLEQDPARPRFLVNEPGMGYRFEPDEPVGA